VKVGDVVKLERTTWQGSPVSHHTATVTRRTKCRAYLGARHWVNLDDPTRQVRPRWLDYTDRVVEVTPQEVTP
jgi:hypothetical protein